MSYTHQTAAINRDCSATNSLSRPQSPNSSSFLGRPVSWLNDSTPGKILKVTGGFLATTALVVASLMVVAHSIAIAILGALSCSTIAGLPLGLCLLAVAAGEGCISYKLYEIAGKCLDFTIDIPLIR